MVKCSSVPVVFCALLVMVSFSMANAAGKPDGKAGFNKYCASCHPNGGNIIIPAKTLKKADLEKVGVKSWKDVVGKIRKPGPGMTAFNSQTISDKEAKEIAEYVLKTFK